MQNPNEKVLELQGQTPENVHPSTDVEAARLRVAQAIDGTAIRTLVTLEQPKPVNEAYPISDIRAATKARQRITKIHDQSEPFQEVA